jgi:hypothetical protein
MPEIIENSAVFTLRTSPRPSNVNTSQEWAPNNSKMPDFVQKNPSENMKPLKISISKFTDEVNRNMDEHIKSIDTDPATWRRLYL